MDLGDGDFQKVTINLPNKEYNEIWKIPNPYGKWKCGVRFHDLDDGRGKVSISARTFECFRPGEDFDASFNASIECDVWDNSKNKLLLQFGENYLDIRCGVQ